MPVEVVASTPVVLEPVAVDEPDLRPDVLPRRLRLVERVVVERVDVPDCIPMPVSLPIVPIVPAPVLEPPMVLPPIVPVPIEPPVVAPPVAEPLDVWAMPAAGIISAAAAIIVKVRIVSLLGKCLKPLARINGTGLNAFPLS